MKKKVFFVFIAIILSGIFFSTTKIALACETFCAYLTPIPCSNPQCSDCNECKVNPSPIPNLNPNDNSRIKNPHLNPNDNSRIKNPLFSDEMNQLSGRAFLQKVLNLVIELLFIGGSIIFFIMLLSGGIRWIASGGDKTRLEGARGQITHALIGLVILLSAFAIIKLIGTLFGVDLLNLSLPTL